MRILFTLTISILCYACSKPTPSREVFIKDFNWTVVIPEGFDSVRSEDLVKLQTRGEEAIEDTYDEDIENHSRVIFMVKSGDMNYMEANQQPFDETVDGDFVESCGAVTEVLYQTFVSQMPGVKVDSASSFEVIDGLEFYKAEMSIAYPNEMVMKFLMYSRLFGKEEFTVNILYADEDKGEQMKSAWKASTFSSIAQ